MPACAIRPADRREQVRLVGNDLVRHHGKRKFYSVEQVRAANRRQEISFDLACWSHAMFNSHADFDDYHRELGEDCDYFAMKTEMVASVSPDAEGSWFDVDLSWLELPDIDFSIFDFLDF